MSILAIETVGTQEIQGGLFDDFVNHALGVHPRVPGRRIGEELAKLEDHDLVDLIGYDTLRNGACYSRLDQETEGEWVLALLATNQEPSHDGDTLGIAVAIRRWFSLCHPDVRVLEPMELTQPPHRAEQPLAREIEGHLTAATTAVRPERLVVLPVGATPAMRVLLEHLAGRVAPSAPQSWLPDGRGGVVVGGLLRTIDADAVLKGGLDRLRAACQGGRYRTATEHAEGLAKLKLISTDVVQWCRVGQRVTSRDPGWSEGLAPSDHDAKQLSRIEQRGGGWIGLLATLVGQVRRAEGDHRTADALIAFVSAAEALALAFLLDHRVIERPGEAQELPAPASNCSLGTSGRPDRKGVADEARNALLCARTQCSACWLQGSDKRATRLRDAPGVEIAVTLRDGKAHRLVQLRNELIHPRAGKGKGSIESRLEQGIRESAEELASLGVIVEFESLHGLLTTAIAGALHRVPADPLDLVDERIEKLLSG